MRKRRAVIFDDDTFILNLLDAFLSRKGYEVTCLSKPVVCPYSMNNEAYCPNDKPCADVLLSDFQMPGMNGLELLEKQRDIGCRIDNRNKAVMSGHIIEEEGMRRELGCACFKKPFLLSELDVWITACEERIPLSVLVGAPRKERRNPVHIPVACSVSSRSRQFSGVVTDVSSSGFCLTTDQALSENDFLTVNAGMPVSCCRAAVRWIRQLEDNGSYSYMAGCNCY